LSHSRLSRRAPPRTRLAAFGAGDAGEESLGEQLADSAGYRTGVPASPEPNCSFGGAIHVGIGPISQNPRQAGEDGRRVVRERTMSTMSTMFDEREVVEAAADRWWWFLLSGIAWLVFALLVFQWDFTTVYAVSFLFGFVALVAGVNEFLQIAVSTTGWKIARGILGVLFVIAGIWALVHPHNAFATIAALIGFFFLFKGIFDLTVAVVAKSQFEVWWIQLVVGIIEILLAFWVAGNFRESTILLVVYVGVIALSRGITELILAFKLKGLKRRLASI
jgi:uncharacterized membrane protein HdeD (DUF308 family)